MSEDFFPLSGTGLRNWLRTAGQALFTEFESGAEALDFLRLQGAAIRDSDFYDIRRQVLGLQKYQDQLEGYRPNDLIPAAWHVDDHGLNLSRDFFYRVRVDGVDPSTGESISKYFAISSDRQLSKGQVEDELGSMIVGEEDFYEIQVSGMEVVSALARPGVL